MQNPAGRPHVVQNDGLVRRPGDQQELLVRAEGHAVHLRNRGFKSGLGRVSQALDGGNPSDQQKLLVWAEGLAIHLRNGGFESGSK